MLERATHVAWLLLLTGCVGGSAGPSDEPFVDSGPWENIGERPCPEDSFLTYDNFGQPFMLSWCTGCHSEALDSAEERRDAPSGIDFDDAASTSIHLERIWIRAADDNTSMPPAGGPGEAERALLGEWLACGAP